MRTDRSVVLGIETSCDETSAAVVVEGVVRSNVISSQLVHKQYGGVVPELASRAHQRLIIQVVKEALQDAAVDKRDLTGVVATYGPGLAGALLVGLNFGKALAFALGVPFAGVNHMEGHLYSNFLITPGPAFPFLALIVSGGHSMLVRVDELFHHTVLGQTRDDAAGEAFDKVAKMLGLGYPGGPVIDRLASEGNHRAIAFPRAFLEEGSFDFSFSGIKTAVLYHLRHRGILSPEQAQNILAHDEMADICASFQAAVVDVLAAKTVRAAEESGVRDVTVAGGVSANSALRARLGLECIRHGWRFFHPQMEYCMDNGAMIAYVGGLMLARGARSSLELSAVANLELS